MCGPTECQRGTVATEYLTKGARFSECRRYRYSLTREWDVSKPLIVWCGLNPSTADEDIDDPTIRREVGFSKDWGFGRYLKLNAYAWRATKPKDMFEAQRSGEDIVGEDNDDTILVNLKKAKMFVACWGANIDLHRSYKLRSLLRGSLRTVHALKLTSKGHPQHPLYMPADTQPFKWIWFEAP